MVTRRNILLGTAGVAAVAAAGLGMAKWRNSRATATNGHFEVTKTPEEWRKMLTPQQYAVLREEDTERPWTSPLNKEKRKGAFACAGCDLPLFLGDEVQIRHGLAELLCADRGQRRAKRGLVVRYAPRRGPLPPLRRPSRPRIQRRAQADRLALLHQRRRPEIHPRLASPSVVPRRGGPRAPFRMR